MQPFIHLCKNKNLQKTLQHLLTGKSHVPHCMKIYQFSTSAISCKALVCVIIYKLETSDFPLENFLAFLLGIEKIGTLLLQLLHLVFSLRSNHF